MPVTSSLRSWQFGKNVTKNMNVNQMDRIASEAFDQFVDLLMMVNGTEKSGVQKTPRIISKSIEKKAALEISAELCL